MSMGIDALGRGIQKLRRNFVQTGRRKQRGSTRDENFYCLLRTADIAKAFVGGILIIVSIRILFSTVTGDFALPGSAFNPNPPFDLTEETQRSVERFYTLHDLLMSTQPLETLAFLRAPILMGLGVILPLAVFVFNWNYRVFIRAGNPYFLLVGAHAVTLFIADRLLGAGAMTFVGIAFSTLRSMQMTSLLKWLSCCYPRTSSEAPPKRCPRILLWGARLEWGLWTLNAAYLTLYVVLVAIGLAGLGLEWRWQ
jgi:hypothetical protein